MAVTGEMLSRRARLASAALASALIAFLGTLQLWAPEDLQLPHCLFRDATGLSCLTCGLTRSLHAASHGHLAAAFELHLFGPVVLAGLVLLILVSVREALTGTRGLRLPHGSHLRFVVLIVPVIWVFYGVVRMIGELT